jgi:transcriptional regulator with XRE-family HTH domain
MSPKPTNKTLIYIGNHLRETRGDKRMTQAEVADKADISPNFYARIERGDTSTSILIFEKIIKALGAKSKDILPF